MSDGYRPWSSRDDQGYRRSPPRRYDERPGRRTDTPPNALNYDDEGDERPARYQDRGGRYPGGGRDRRDHSRGRSRSPGRAPRDGGRHTGRHNDRSRGQAGSEPRWFCAHAWLQRMLDGQLRCETIRRYMNALAGYNLRSFPAVTRREQVLILQLHCRADNFPQREFCYKCNIPRTMDNSPFGSELTGETDQNPPEKGFTNIYLVIWDLGESVTEQILAEGVKKLFVDNGKTAQPVQNASNTTNKLKSTHPTYSTVGRGARPGSLKRVFLMRDRRTNASRKYGFAEFASYEDGAGAISKYEGYGGQFTIASKIVKVAYAHTGVWVPLEDGDPTDPNFTFFPITTPNTRARYWNESNYPSIFQVSIEQPPEHPISGQPADKGDATSTDKAMVPGKEFKAFKVKKAKKDQESSSAAKIAMNPEIQRWKMKAVELHGQTPKSVDGKPLMDVKFKGLGSSVISQSDDKSGGKELDGAVFPSWTDQYVSYADWDRVACLLCNWEVPSVGQVDQKGFPECTREEVLEDHELRFHQLYKDAGAKEQAAAKLRALNKEPRTVIRRTPRLKSQPLPRYKSYVDFENLHCHICKVSFKRIEALHLHEQEDQMHKRHISHIEAVTRATAELTATGKTGHKMVPDKATREQHAKQPQYRDRAKERRQVFGQPKKPKPKTTSAGEKRKEIADPVPEEVPLAKKSKGAGMMAKMGWTAGAGLGAEGTGRTEAIPVDAYAEGVGLGAEGGKIGDAATEAARKTRGNPLDFVEKTKDKARERFEKLA